jgi:tetrahydromethanopterin S-methyltransferase subunit D
MRTVLVRTVLAMVVAGMASTAGAQETPRPARPFSQKALERVVRENSQKRGGVPLSRYAGGRKDSVVNGGLIGAAIGGVGGSFLIVAASGGSDDFPRAMMNVAAFPAIGGFVIGALIDAMY